MEQLLDLDHISFASSLQHGGRVYSIFIAQDPDGPWLWFVIDVQDRSLADISQVYFDSAKDAVKAYTVYFEAMNVIGWTPLGIELRTTSSMLGAENIPDPTDEDLEEEERIMKKEELKTEEEDRGLWSTFVSWLKGVISGK